MRVLGFAQAPLALGIIPFLWFRRRHLGARGRGGRDS